MMVITTTVNHSQDSCLLLVFQKVILTRLRSGPVITLRNSPSAAGSSLQKDTLSKTIAMMIKTQVPPPETWVTTAVSLSSKKMSTNTETLRNNSSPEPMETGKSRWYSPLTPSERMVLWVSQMVNQIAANVLVLNATVAPNPCHSVKPSKLTLAVMIAFKTDNGLRVSTPEFIEMLKSFKL